MFFFTLIVCFLITLLITPFIKKISYIVGAIDLPQSRKVHKSTMPRLGGLAIYISFIVGILILHPPNEYSFSILLASIMIVITGIIDDIFEISAGWKLLGQTAAAAIVVFYGGLQIQFINLPFGQLLYFGFLSGPITLFWIIGITNAINLIDGLDGLAAGVSSIALISISGMAIIMGNLYVLTVGSILLISALGFLFFNFYPAKIFMGDTGALFLGFMISVLSLLGFKNVAFVSFIVPVIILGVPISDTIFAIFRRIINKRPISAPDRSHLHHCLLRLGYTHRQTVLIIYGFSMFFGLMAVIFSQIQFWGSLFLVVLLTFLVEIFAEKIGLFGRNFHPLLRLVGILQFFNVNKSHK